MFGQKTMKKKRGKLLKELKFPEELAV
jgi:hypothetical protein